MLAITEAFWEKNWVSLGNEKLPFYVVLPVILTTVLSIFYSLATPPLPFQVLRFLERLAQFKTMMGPGLGPILQNNQNCNYGIYSPWHFGELSTWSSQDVSFTLMPITCPEMCQFWILIRSFQVRLVVVGSFTRLFTTLLNRAGSGTHTGSKAQALKLGLLCQ